MILGQRLQCFIRKLKSVPRESWVVRPKDATLSYEEKDTSHLKIENYRDVKMKLTLGLPEGKAPTPISPFLHSLTVKKPKILTKIYRWCSCGMSLKQPFCDGSHLGTSFKPLKFVLEEPVKEIQLCGCKLSSEKPFCDGKACEAKAKLQAQHDAVIQHRQRKFRKTMQEKQKQKQKNETIQGQQREENQLK